MPKFRTQRPPFNPPRELVFEWEAFNGGLNTLFKDTEIADNEVAQFQNLMLAGKGIPTKRWGTDLYFTAYTSTATISVRGLGGFYQKDGTNQLLSVTDQGFLSRRNGSSFTAINGVSWASGSNVEMTQISDRMYFVGGSRELARYSNPTLVGFPTIGLPTSVGLSQLSGASGPRNWSYRLTHITDVGETVASSAIVLNNQPEDTNKGTIRVAWTNVSTASGIRKGTNIYKGDLGRETFVARADGESAFWLDDGTAVPTQFAFPPTVDGTGGANAKYIVRFQDRLVIAGVTNDPTLVMISGAEPLHERFDFGSNGGFVRVEPDSGDDITGLAVKADKIIVFKERSVWQITLEQRAYKTVNEITLTALDPQVQLITASIGCASHRTIQNVENDILFLAKGGRGVFVLGNEPGIIGDILRTNEVSIKVRPFFESLTASEESTACGIYFGNKYFLGIPSKSQTMVFDRERSSWLGPWTFDGRIFHVYYDSNDQANLLKGNVVGPDVERILQSYPGDRGVAFETILRTKREEFKDFSHFKNIKNIFTLWRDLAGSVSADIRLEEAGGNTITAKSFTVTTGSGNSGFGADFFGNTQFGDSEEKGEARDLSEVVKQALLNKSARNVQMIIKTSALNDDYKLMKIRGEARIIGQFRPSRWKVALIPFLITWGFAEIVRIFIISMPFTMT